MYNISENVRIVISLLKEHKIDQLVLNPGGTNAGFVRGVQDDPFFNCYSIVDERSAVYFAIGLYLSTKKTVAVCCTSAQATRNYIPGLTEAFYKHVPILAITFSKHPQYTYQEYMQAPDQTSLPADAVKKTFSLPYVSNSHDRKMCERMANEAMLEILHRAKGPVQLNVPMLDDQLALDTVKELPVVKTINRRYSFDGLLEKCNEKKILVVVGENSGITNHQLDPLVHSLNAVIYVNHLSNYEGDYTIKGNLLLSAINQEYFDKYLCPDILITIGGQTGDYPLFHKLSDSDVNYCHWRVDVEGKVVDTYDHLTEVLEMNEDTFLSSIQHKDSIHSYYEIWTNNNGKINRNIDFPLSNIYIAQQLTPVIPSGSIVNFAILNSLRSWSYFEFHNPVTCNANVGAFGIDGGMSTFIGQSILTEKMCYMIIGDLAFLYDINSLSIKYIKNNIRIILINNNGGIEFKLWGDSEKDRKTDRYVAAANHFRNAQGWAETCGFEYYPVRSKEEFGNIKEILLRDSKKPMLLEIFVRDEDDRAAFSLITSKNRDLFLEGTDRIKHGIRRILSK